MGKIYISTTGTQSPVVITDLGARTFTHPTTNYELTTEYTEFEIGRSVSLQAAVTAGHVTIVDENANLITNLLTVAGNSHNAITLPFAGETSSGVIAPYITLTNKASNGFLSIMSFPYRGTNTATPLRFIIRTANEMLNDANTFTLRIVDITNSSNLICTQTVVGYTYNDGIYTNGRDFQWTSFSNLPASQATFELSCSLTDNNNRNFHFWWFQIQF